MDGITPKTPTSFPATTALGEKNETLKDKSYQAFDASPDTGASYGSSIKNKNNASIIPGLKNLLDSITLSPDVITAVLGKITGDTDANRMATMQQTVARLTKRLNELCQERLETIKKNHDEQVKVDKKNAENKRKSSGIFGWLKRIFKAVVAVLTVVAAAAATVATGGMAAPLLALAVLALASTALSIASDIDKERGGKGFDHITQWMDPGSLVGKGMGALAKKLGASDSAAAIVSTSFAVATTLAIVIASAVISCGASAQESLGKVIAVATAIAGLVNGAITISEGVSDREIADIERDIALLQSQLQKVLANYVDSSQQREEMMDGIKALMDKINSMPSIVSKIIEEYGKSISQTINNMSTPHA